MPDEGNEDYLFANTDPLNVLGDVVPPLSPELMDKIRAGRGERSQILDGSMLPQHDDLTPYALTHVVMTFEKESDLVRCARMLQWSDARLRGMESPEILWEWKKVFRNMMQIEFAVGWYSKDFFEERRDAFLEPTHASYYSTFGMTPDDIKIRHEILE